MPHCWNVKTLCPPGKLSVEFKVKTVIELLLLSAFFSNKNQRALFTYGIGIKGKSPTEGLIEQSVRKVNLPSCQISAEDACVSKRSHRVFI